MSSFSWSFIVEIKKSNCKGLNEENGIGGSTFMSEIASVVSQGFVTLSQLFFLCPKIGGCSSQTLFFYIPSFSADILIIIL
jgi:hypothetical protein